MTELDRALGTLSRSDPARLKAFAETLIGELGEIEVIRSRTGLVMVPMRDTAQGTAFHLGEVLVSEAHIRRGDAEGYGMCRGHDLEASMAMALVDLALATGTRPEACAAFVEAEARAQHEADTERLRKVEATRVDMETF